MKRNWVRRYNKQLLSEYVKKFLLFPRQLSGPNNESYTQALFEKNYIVDTEFCVCIKREGIWYINSKSAYSHNPVHRWISSSDDWCTKVSV